MPGTCYWKSTRQQAKLSQESKKGKVPTHHHTQHSHTHLNYNVYRHPRRRVTEISMNGAN